MAQLANIRRVVTGHDQQGKAIIKNDSSIATTPIPSGDAEFALLWTAPTLPVDNNDETDGRERDAGLTLKCGSVLRVVDMLPGQASPFHRSNSLDYGIVMSGQVELEVDNEQVVLLSAGDIIIQRGTIHLWRNPSKTEPCRIVFVLTEATPASINGVTLAEVHP